jgi:hypothetical protein
VEVNLHAPFHLPFARSDEFPNLAGNGAGAKPLYGLPNIDDFARPAGADSKKCEIKSPRRSYQQSDHSRLEQL